MPEKLRPHHLCAIAHTWLARRLKMDELKLDKRGNIITQPVTGYELTYLDGIGVLLSVDYVDNPRRIKIGVTRRVQLALTPKRAKQLGESLQRVTNRLLEPRPSGTKLN
jgi:hypothetical protein